MPRYMQIYIYIGLDYMSRYLHLYKFYNELAVMGLGLKKLHEELSWSSITARRNWVLDLNVRQA